MDDPSTTLKMCEEKETVFILCRRGNASREAVDFLINKHNVKNVLNVIGGITEYSIKVDSKVPMY